MSVARYRKFVCHVCVPYNKSLVYNCQNIHYITSNLSMYPIAILNVTNFINSSFFFQVKMLSMVGGHGLKSIVLNILTRTLNNTVATKYSWVGGKKKLVFSNLFLWKIILGE